MPAPHRPELSEELPDLPELPDTASTFLHMEGRSGTSPMAASPPSQRRLRALHRHIAGAAAATPPPTNPLSENAADAVAEYTAYGLEWAPLERLPPPTKDIMSADAYDIPDPPQTGPGGRDANSPLGTEVQGYAGAGGDLSLRGTHPVFNPRTQFDEAFRYYQEHGFTVIELLSEEEVVAMNAVADEWCSAADRVTLNGQGELVFPLVHYEEVDFTVTHENQKPLIDKIMGGWEHVRMVEFNCKIVILSRIACCPSR